MQYETTSLSDVWVLEPTFFDDQRGSFAETFRLGEFCETIGQEVRFIQDNQSLSHQKGTLRGLHYQKQPHAQGKLVRCLQGALFDVAVDLRPQSETFGRWFGLTLEPSKAQQLWIPKGFAHGFMTLEDHTMIAYRVDAPYHPESEQTLRWDDPSVKIDWPLTPTMMSEKDQQGTFLRSL